MTRIAWLAALIMLALPAPARAAEPAVAAWDALPGMAQSGCLEKLFNAADKKLNDVYRHAVKTIDQTDTNDTAEWKAALKTAQRAWIAFRDADCGALTGYEWHHGTGMGAATEQCLLEKTQARTRDLTRRYLEDR